MSDKKFWLSILAISVVLIAGSLAVSPIAIADDDDDDEVEASIEAELELKQDGTDVDIEVEAEGLQPDKSFTVRAYLTSTNCKEPPAVAIGPKDSEGDGDFEISGTIPDEDVDDVKSVSIRITGSPGSNPPVVCFQDL